jgi:hypothetical protein
MGYVLDFRSLAFVNLISEVASRYVPPGSAETGATFVYGMGARDEFLLIEGDQGGSISLCLQQRALKLKSNTTALYFHLFSSSLQIFFFLVGFV